MKNWISVSLPGEYTELLRVNYKTNKEIKENLSRLTRVNPGFFNLFFRCFKDVDPVGNVDRVLSSVGWKKVRDSLGAMYVDYCELGHFPDAPKESTIRKLNEIENVYRHISFTGSSRLFLLNFYFLLAGASKNK